jgi:chromate transporter
MRLVDAQVIPPVLLELAQQFGTLSFLAIGGVNALIPDIHRRVVEIEHWMTDAQFSQAFAISQASPGPNMLIVSVIGWNVYGFLGALVATLAICLPSSMLTYGISHVWNRFRDAPFRAAIQRGLAPVTVGLVLASGYVLVRATDTTWVSYALTASTTLLALSTRIHPLWLLLAAGGLGAFGLV